MKRSLLILFCWLPKQQKEIVELKTKSGDNVTILSGKIHYNKKIISEPISDIVYGSRYNRIIEDNGSIFLFVEVDDRPNFNMLQVYRLTSQKASEILESVYNDDSQGNNRYPKSLQDLDQDGYIEFGGFGLTEGYDNKDSMYYNPSRYYEIKKGEIVFDSAFTKKMDIKENGVYIKNPLNKDGNCCIVIRKPRR